MHLSDIGNFLYTQLKNVKQFYETIDIPEYVIMPNHLHAIVRICNPYILEKGNSIVEQRCTNPSLRANATCQRYIPLLSRYISSLKNVVTKFAKLNQIEFCWQSRYHDHLIRKNSEGNKIVDYIRNNIVNWQNDCFYPDE